MHVEAEVRRLRHPERSAIALVPPAGLAVVGLHPLGDRQRLGPVAVHLHAHRVEVVAGHQPAPAVGRAGQGVDASPDTGVDGVERPVHVAAGGQPGGRLHPEVEVPHQLFQGSGRVGGGLVVVGHGHVATEALGTDPPAIAVGVDAGDGLQVGQDHVGQGPAVVGGRGAPVVPEAQSSREHGGDHRLVDRREQVGLGVAGQEGVDVAGEPVDPRRVAEAGVLVGEAEVAQVDHRGEPVPLAGRQGSVPQGPVVDAGLGLGQPPRHAVPPDPHAQPGHRGQVLVEVVEVSAGGQLVDPHLSAVVEHERIRRLLAARHHEVREPAHLSLGRWWRWASAAPPAGRRAAAGG